MQDFCILAEISRFLAYCLFKGMYNFCIPRKLVTAFVNFYAFYRFQNFCVLVELINFRPLKTIEKDAEFLHHTKIVNAYALQF